jgi:hypothetical protein
MAKKHPFLERTGLTEDQFYKRYTTEQDFFSEYPDMSPEMQVGGATQKQTYRTNDRGFEIPDPSMGGAPAGGYKFLSER